MISLIFSTSLLIGRWQYDHLIYRGESIPRPNPRLVLFFEFYRDGTDLLSWHYQGERGGCARKARYQVRNHLLKQTVTEVSPENLRECGSDPDLRKGLTTTTPIRIQKNRLEMDLPLGEERMTYVFLKKTSTDLLE